MEYNPLPDLLNTIFTIFEISLFYGCEHLGAKICRFLTFLTRSLHDDRGILVVTKLGMTTCENTSNTGLVLLMASCFVKTLNLLPKEHADKF